MKKLVRIQLHDQDKTYVLDQHPITIGNSESCTFLHHKLNLPVSLIIQDCNDHILVSSLDESIKLSTSNETSNNLKIFEGQTIQYHGISLGLEFSPSEKSIGNTLDVLPELPVDSHSTYENIPTAQELQVQEEQIEIEEEIVENPFIFNITFDEENFSPKIMTPYEDKSYNYESYINIWEEERTPQEVFDKKETFNGLHFTYMNNGVVLKEKYFKSSINRLFLSNKKNAPNIFQVEESEFVKSDIAFTKDGKTFINRQKDFVFYSVDENNNLREIGEDLHRLEEDERVILSKGSSQIIIRHSEIPPKLLSDDFLAVDPKLVKLTTGLWTGVLVPLLLLLLFVEIPKPPEIEKEIIMVYKPKPKNLVVNPSEEEQNQKVEEVKKKEDTSKLKNVATNEKKKIEKKPKKATKMASIKKKKSAPTKAKSKAKKVAKVSKVKKSVKKYNFSTASKFKALMGSSMEIKATQKGAKAQVSESIGKLAATANSPNTDLGVSSSNVSKFATKGRNIGSSSFSTAGLSSKTEAMSAFDDSATKVLGAIDPNLIRKLLREHIPFFRTCYQNELNGNSELTGVFDLLFEISPGGRGRGVKVRSKGGKFTKKGVRCLAKVVAMITFPKPKGGGSVDVRQPLNFYSLKK